MKWSWRRRREAELDEELEAHVAIEVKQRIDRGESREQAEATARRQFGNVMMVKEVTRETWRLSWLDSVAQDLRYAWRGMWKTLGFAAIVVLILAMGAGLNTAIFTTVNAAIIRPLPFERSDRLVRIWATRNGVEIGGLSVLDGRDFAAASRNLEGVVVYDHWRKNVSGIGDFSAHNAPPERRPVRISGSSQADEMVVGLVPGSYFDLLRIKPILGRTFTPEESRYGSHFVAVIGSGFWRSRYHSDPAAIGQTVRINAETYTIVGIMPDVIPPWMDQTALPISIWTPFSSEDMWSEGSRTDRGNYALGRLKPGVTVAQASAELSDIAARLAREHPVDSGVGVAIEPIADARSRPVRPVLLMLSGAVAVILIIACANLASLLLARNSARSREMAVRAALGAVRGRMVRQLLLESFVLSIIGGMAGIGLSCAAGYVLSNLNSGKQLPYTTHSNLLGQYWSPVPDGRVLLFGLGIAVLTTFLVGLAPAITGTRVSLADTLREAARTSTAGSGRQRLRRLLVITEVALSLVLVVAATMLIETLTHMQRQDPGFRSDHLLLAHIYIPPARYPDADALTRFCDALRKRIQALPGVVDASIATGYPPSIGWRQMFSLPGTTPSRIEDVPTARFAYVDAHYLRTIGLSLAAGRDFAESDTPTSPVVGVVNEAFARQYFPDRNFDAQNGRPGGGLCANAVGRVIHQGPPRGVLAPSLQAFGGGTKDMTIVGVVRNFMNNGLAMPPTAQIFMLFRQQPSQNFGFKEIVVRTLRNPESIIPPVSRELQALDPDIPLSEVRSMETHMRNGAADLRLTTGLLSLFAALGTLLSLVGSYGVVSFLVAQRTSELGLRVALGASRAAIVWLVLRSGLLIGVSGVGAGLAGTIVVRRVFARLLAGSTAVDPLTTFGAALVLMLVVVMAGAMPARRALHVDPVTALRSE